MILYQEFKWGVSFRRYAKGSASDHATSEQSISASSKLTLNLENVPDSDLDDFFKYLDEGEIDPQEQSDLLDWASKLDFQEYFNNWFMIGASGFTDRK